MPILCLKFLTLLLHGNTQNFNLMSEAYRGCNKCQCNGLTPLGFSSTAKVMRIYITKHVLLNILMQHSIIISPLYVNASMLIATAATLSPTLTTLSPALTTLSPTLTSISLFL